MKKISLVIMLLFAIFTLKTNAQETTDSEKIKELEDKTAGLFERLAITESDLGKLTKIKISGYVQAQYQHFEDPTFLVRSQDYFSVRRARLKFVYEPLDGIKFVLQPDFVPGNVTIKDAYAVVNDHWTKSFSLWAGKFNRPNYEVEYSSSQREVMERSMVIRTLYPGERALGAKLEFNPQSLPLHLQFALLNGNDGLVVSNYSGSNINATENVDFDKYKDIMVRATYNLTLGSFGGLDFGVNGYWGGNKSVATKTLSSDYETINDIEFGDRLQKNWYGGEFQFFADVLGGMSLKGEYITGKNATNGYMPVPPSGSVPAQPGLPNFQNNFAGYYLYLIKNLGKKNQLAFRYDYYDPNTDITGTDVGIKEFTSTDATVKSKTSGKADLATSTLSFGLHHYFDDNIRVSVGYDIVKNEKAGTEGKVTEKYTDDKGQSQTLDWSNHINRNILTLRIQAKF